MKSTRKHRSVPFKSGTPRFPAVEASDAGASGWVSLKGMLIDTSALTEELNRNISVVPRLNTDHYIYPEMEKRYAAKEELESKLSAAVERLRAMLPDLDRRVDRCHQVLQRVQADSAKLNLPEARRDYSEAEDAARKEYLSALHHRDWTVVTITKAEAVLAIARKKQFPHSGACHRTDGGEKNGKADQDRRRETDGLISLGPLGNVEEKVY
jgi:hypothetical protein